MVAFNFIIFLHLLVDTNLGETAFSSYFCLFISILWTPGFLFYSAGYNLLLLFVLMLMLSQIWLVALLSSGLL